MNTVHKLFLLKEIEELLYLWELYLLRFYDFTCPCKHLFTRCFCLNSGGLKTSPHGLYQWSSFGSHVEYNTPLSVYKIGTR